MYSKLSPCLGGMQLGSVRGSSCIWNSCATCHSVTYLVSDRMQSKFIYTVIEIIKLTCYWENSGVLFPKLVFILPLS